MGGPPNPSRWSAEGIQTAELPSTGGSVGDREIGEKNAEQTGFGVQIRGLVFLGWGFWGLSAAFGLNCCYAKATSIMIIIFSGTDIATAQVSGVH